jgi:hypothetical protein
MIVLKPVDRVEVLSVMDVPLSTCAMATRPLHGGRRLSATACRSHN